MFPEKMYCARVSVCHHKTIASVLLITLLTRLIKHNREMHRKQAENRLASILISSAFHAENFIIHPKLAQKIIDFLARDC